MSAGLTKNMAKYSGKKTSLLFAENITKTLAIYRGYVD
jgi:tryptophan synthase beta subunit